MSGPHEGVEGLHDPPTGSFDTAAIAAAGDGHGHDAFHGASRLMGHRVADAFSRRCGALHRVTPMLGGALDDGGYLRALLGNLYFALPLLGFVLGLVGGISTSGQAVPPGLALCLALLALGAFDAFAGLCGLGGFTLVVLLTGNLLGGHMFSAQPGIQTFIYSFTALFGLGVLWFAGGMVARRIRPIRRIREGSDASRWAQRIVDFVAVPVIGTLVVWFAAWQLPTLAGNAPDELFVTIQNHLLAVKVVAFCALLGRALLESATKHHFAERIAAVDPAAVRRRPALLAVLFWAIRGAIGAMVLWEVLGSGWMTWVALALLLVISPALWFGKRLPRLQLSSWHYPLVLLRLVVVVVLVQLLLSILVHHLVNPGPMLGAVVIGAGVLLVLFALLDHPLGVGERRDIRTAVADAIAVALVVVFVWGVPAFGSTPFDEPHGVYVAPTGSVIVADTANNRVVLIGKNGFRETIGEGLSDPSDVAGDGDPEGYVYIVDAGNDRIERLSGYYAYTVGYHSFNHAASGLGNGVAYLTDGLDDPQSACVNGLGDLLVADTGNNRVVEFNRKTWQATTLLADVNHPMAVLCDPFWTLTYYVTEWASPKQGGGKIWMVPPKGRPTEIAWGLDEPAGLAMDPWGNLYVSEMGNGKVLEYPASDPNYDPIVVDTGLDQPRGLSVDALGNLFIADAGGGQVKVLATLREQQLVTHGIPDPVAVAAGEAGNVYVVDHDQGWVQDDRDGTLSTFATGIVDPVGVAAGPSHEVWVDTSSGRLLLVHQGGKRHVVAEGLADPRQLYAVPGGDGAVLVAVEGSGEILEVQPDGATKVVLHGLDDPVGVAVEGGVYTVGLEDGNVYQYGLVGPRQLLYNLRGISAIAMDAEGNSYVASSRYRLIVEHVAATGRDAVVNREFRSLAGMSSTPTGTLWVGDPKSIGLIEIVPTGFQQFHTQL